MSDSGVTMEAMMSEDTHNDESLQSLSNDGPLVVTLAPKSTSSMYEKLLTSEEAETLRIALMSNSVVKMARAVRSISVLAQEIRKQNVAETKSSVRTSTKKTKTSAASASKPTEDSSGQLVVKKRAPRTQPSEPRRPWKPERLDTSKPILQCDACGYQANRRDYMRRHQIRVHSDYRPYQCTMCDFKTTEKHDLDRHMNSKYHGGKGLTQKRTKMTATVKIKCDQCNYTTKSVKSILRHKQTHAIEKRHAELYGDVSDSEQQVLEQDDNVESMDATDPVTVLMMNDLMSQESTVQSN